MNKKKFFTQLKKIKSGIKPAYIKYLSLPVDDKLVLLEGGQGTNINGNMFSMLRELNTNPRWSEYITAFVVTSALNAPKSLQLRSREVKQNRKVCRHGTRKSLN